MARHWYLRESLIEQAAKASEQIAAYTQPSPTKKATRKRVSDSDQEQDNQSTSKMSLSSQEQQQVAELFSTEIAQGVLTRKKYVVAKMKDEDPILKKVLVSPDKVKKVIDRVRYLKQKEPAGDPYQLPEDSPTKRRAEYVNAPSTSGDESLESGRVDWSEEETQLIEEALYGYEKCPRNTNIRRIFHTSPQLEAILKQNPFEWIRNKVKKHLSKDKSLSKENQEVSSKSCIEAAQM